LYRRQGVIENERRGDRKRGFALLAVVRVQLFEERRNLVGIFEV